MEILFLFECICEKQKFNGANFRSEIHIWIWMLIYVADRKSAMSLSYALYVAKLISGIK